MQTSHNFDPEAFLQPFEGREHLLEEYLDSLPPAGLTVTRPVASAESFKNHLEICPSVERRVLVTGMVEAWEMASDDGHEQLLAALRANGGSNGNHTELPAECLALHLLSTDRDVFESALSLDEMRKCEALELFKPQSPVQLVGDLAAAKNHFRSEMAARCGEKYGSQRILMRQFGESDILSVGFYFERPPKARRTLSGSVSEPHLARDEARPLQFDALIFEPGTGILSIRSSWGRLTEHIRRAFATAFLAEPDAYEWPGASRILQLSEFFTEEDELLDTDGSPPVITDLEYAPTHDDLEARYKITGTNVLAIVRRDGNITAVHDSRIRRLVLKMALEGSARRRRVQLTAPNKVNFKRGAGADQIIGQLRDWHVLQAPAHTAITA